MSPEYAQNVQAVAGLRKPKARYSLLADSRMLEFRKTANDPVRSFGIRLLIEV